MTKSEYWHKQYIKHRDKRILKQKEYNKLHKPEISIYQKEYQKEWNKRNRDKNAERQRKCRARKKEMALKEKKMFINKLTEYILNNFTDTTAYKILDYIEREETKINLNDYKNKGE